MNQLLRALAVNAGIKKRVQPRPAALQVASDSSDYGSYDRVDNNYWIEVVGGVPF